MSRFEMKVSVAAESVKDAKAYHGVQGDCQLGSAPTPYVAIEIGPLSIVAKDPAVLEQLETLIANARAGLEKNVEQSRKFYDLMREIDKKARP